MVSELKRRQTSEFLSKMMENILDSKLMEDYGTSIPVNMGREYQNHLDKKYLDLKEEFNKINKDLDDGIDIEELGIFLNNYSHETGKIFEKDYVTKLFSLIDKDKSNKITVQEFVTTYIILEEKIRVKQIRMGKALEIHQKLLEKQKKLVNENKGEILNKNGISTKAELNISIIEAKGLPTRNLMGKSQPFVQLTVGKKKEKSRYVNGQENPVWKEDFKINIESLNEELKIEIFDKFQTDEKDILGGLTIPLISLKNQEKKEDWFDLNSDDGAQASILIKIQLIWSFYQLALEKVNKIEDKISRISSDMKNLEQYMDLFQKPFGILLYVELDDAIEKLLWEDNEDYLKTSKDNRKTALANPNKNNLLNSSTDKILQSSLNKLSIEWSNLIKIPMYCILILSFISIFGRSDFINVSISIAIWIIFIRSSKYEVIDEIKKFYRVLIFAIIYDILWFFFHNKGFSHSEYNGAIKKFTLFAGYLNLIGKIILFVGLYLQLVKHRENNSKSGLRKSQLNQK